MQPEQYPSQTEGLFQCINPYIELTTDFAKGGMMNSWPNELMAEYHRRRILQEAEQIRLEKIVQRAGMDRPGFFERMMFNIASWMISTGKQLRTRYEISKEEQWIRPRTKAIS